VVGGCQLSCILFGNNGVGLHLASFLGTARQGTYEGEWLTEQHCEVLQLPAEGKAMNEVGRILHMTHQMTRRCSHIGTDDDIIERADNSTSESPVALCAHSQPHVHLTGVVGVGRRSSAPH
jgi:hypothetical protein